jgi:hypothetical protein
MNRLRDESGLDPISEKGIGILRAVRPTSSPAGLRRKVWSSLQQTSIASPVRARFSALRVVVVGVGLLLFTATAAATIGGRKLAARIERLWAPRARVGDAPTRPERTKTVRVAEAPSAPAGEALAPIDEAKVSATAVEPQGRMPSPPAPAGHGAVRASRAAAVAAETSRERAQVWEALVALRRDHDANRAAARLNHDLETNRHSVLRQEALALAIEAADSRGDRAGAAQLARTYVGEFPAGRFKAFAQSHLELRLDLDQKSARLPAPSPKQ